MESNTLKVVIPFAAVLAQITDALSLPKPKYRLLNAEGTNVAVFVTNRNSSLSSVYVGGRKSTLVSSFERAAELAVVDMLAKYHIRVEDITASIRRNVQRRATLNVLRRFEQELGPEKMPEVWEIIRQQSLEPYDGKCIHLDYVDTMHHIFSQINITGVWLQTVEIDTGLYVSWLTLPTSPVLPRPETIFSKPYNTRFEAQQKCAKKVILFLLPIYRLEVVDANYSRSGVDYNHLLQEMAAEQYLAVREALMLINTEGENRVLDLTAGPSTPAGSRHVLQIVELSDLPPKKRPAYPRTQAAVRESRCADEPCCSSPPIIAPKFGLPCAGTLPAANN